MKTQPRIYTCPRCRVAFTKTNGARHAASCTLFGDSPAENSNPSGASEGTDGRGVSTNPLGAVNRDKTGERMVRKGVTVDYFGLRCRVLRVRKGTAYCTSLVSGTAATVDCAQVKVVA